MLKTSNISKAPNLMMEAFRWYGPNDPVSLEFIRQSGAESVFSSLHHIPYGEIWPLQEIVDYKNKIEAAGLKWIAVESLPVSEAIKTRSGDFKLHIENYKKSIQNLGLAGIHTVIYNFMPVLDWVRTDFTYTLDDGAQALFFDPVKFAAFDIFLLKRENADADHDPSVVIKARDFFQKLNSDERVQLQNQIIDIFPGTKLGLSIDSIREMISSYQAIDADKLREHHHLFLRDVIPVCESSGVKMAIHPDDPPWPILGLPRIVSTESDFEKMISAVDSPANGICFCTGSLSPRDDNDLPGMIERLGHRINCFHLRSTQRNPDGSFYEASHLDGSVDMVKVVSTILNLMKKRHNAGEADLQFFFRPDHGHTILDDQSKTDVDNPGYSAIGRLKGLAEIRGLQRGISVMLENLSPSE